MTVVDLIRELQAMPQHSEVMLRPASMCLSPGEVQHAIESGGWFEPSHADEQRVSDVRYEGAYVLLKG